MISRRHPCTCRLAALLIGSLGIIGGSSLDAASALGGEEARQPPGPKVARPIDPVLAECTLQIAGQTLKPSRIIHPWRPEYRGGDWYLSLEKDTVSGRNGTEPKARWTAKSPDGLTLEWLNSDRSTAYFVSYATNKDGWFDHYASAEPP